MKTVIRIYYQVLGGHTHMRVFVGTEGKKLGLAGELCMTNDEFEALKLGTAKLEFVEDIPVPF